MYTWFVGVLASKFARKVPELEGMLAASSTELKELRELTSRLAGEEGGSYNGGESMQGESNPGSHAPSSTDNGWGVWGKHVLAELERFDGMGRELTSEVMKIHVELAALKVKSGVWGLMGALIPIVITLGVAFIVHFVKGSK